MVCKCTHLRRINVVMLRAKARVSVCQQVVLEASMEGVFNTTLELFTKGGAASYLSVTAAVMAPSLALTPVHLDLGVTHLGVPRVCSLTLLNLTMLPTSFAWEAYGSGAAGSKGGELSVALNPVQGLLQPGQLNQS